VETVQDIEERLGPLTALQDLGRHIEERFESLQALADEVTVKAQTLNDQKEMIEQAEARLGRLDEVAAETTAQLERREQLKDELGRELARLETDVQIPTESGRRQVEASRTESVVWEDLRAQLRETEQAIKQSVAEGAALKGQIDERFEALHALAEEVTVKGQMLNGQREMIEHTVVEARRSPA
jgi:DNA repair exonuclease SbcCD ATPase subunit